MEVKEAIIPSSAQNGYLLRLFNVHVKSGRRAFREHHHTEFEIVLFKSGRGTYTVTGKSYDIMPGDIFLFSTNEVHCITEIAEGEEMVLMNVHFEPRFIWSSGNDLFDAKYLKIFFGRNDKFENRLDRENPARDKIGRMLLNMEEEFFQKPAEYVLMVKAELLKILVTLIRSFDYVSEDDDDLYFYRQNFPKIEAAMNYIHQNLCSDLTLDRLAQEANMSRAYFSTIFKKLNGVTPWEYITAHRIERAISLLERDTLTIMEIALQCGFNNTANFNHAFKRVTGKTPTGYKNDPPFSKNTP